MHEYLPGSGFAYRQNGSKTIVFQWLTQWFPTGGKFPPGGEILVFQRGNSGRAGNINIEVNIALINIHVSLIFLNNSWKYSTDKSKSQYVYLSTKY